MKKPVLISLAALAAAATVAGTGYQVYEHAPTLAMPLVTDRTPDRQASRQFANSAIAYIRDQGDLDKFKCLNLLPYEMPSPLVCGKQALFDNKTYVMNTRYTLDESERKLFDTPALHDAFHLFITAHEFNHYLNFKAGRHQVHGNGPAAAMASHNSSIQNEYTSDMFGIATVRAYLPQQSELFEQRLIKWRRHNELHHLDYRHAKSALVYITGKDDMPAVTRDIEHLSRYSLTMAARGNQDVNDNRTAAALGLRPAITPGL